MAQYVTTIETPRAPADAFAYMANLCNFAEWDPGVRSAEQVAGDGPGPNAEYDVVVDAPRGGLTLRYVTVDFDEPRSVTVRAESRWFTSLDTIVVTPAGDGSVVRYDARLTLNGPLKMFDLALRPVFGRIGERANRGLLEALQGTQA